LALLQWYLVQEEGEEGLSAGKGVYSVVQEERRLLSIVREGVYSLMLTQ
jgi:hypothetical protein